MNSHTRSLILGSLLLFATGCATQSAVATRPTTPTRTGDTRPAGDPAKAPGNQAQTAEAEAPPPSGTLYYDLDSAQLSPDSFELLQAMATWLRQHPSESVQIAGHTCDLGTSEYNLALGNKRAAAARDYLVRLGVEPQRVAIVSFGEENPAIEAETESGRAKNRRSEFEYRMVQKRAGR